MSGDVGGRSNRRRPGRKRPRWLDAGLASSDRRASKATGRSVGEPRTKVKPRKTLSSLECPHRRPGSSRHDEDTEILLNPKRARSIILSSRAGRMATPAPITIPTESIASIRSPIDLIERVAKTDSEDPNLAHLYENAIRDTMERFEATGSVDPLLKPWKKCTTIRSEPGKNWRWCQGDG